MVYASLLVFSVELKLSQLEDVLRMIIGCNTCELLEQIIKVQVWNLLFDSLFIELSMSLTYAKTKYGT